MERIKSILKDTDFFGVIKNYNVNQFFFIQGCFLKTHTFDGKYAGNIINHYCAAYNINQKLILVTLQREMGLISKKDVAEVKEYTRPNGEKMYPLDWACGCGVPDFEPSKSKYRGFENQISGACATYRKHYDAWKPETIKELLDKEIKKCVPENAVTYSLLCYTPHLDSLTTTGKIYFRYFPET